MEKATKDKLAAADKIALGVGQAASAIALATGHGFIGGFLRRHQMIHHGFRLAAHSMDNAKSTIEEGLRDWESSNR